ncbi:MAG: DUF3047 domain-containing protein, partial [Halofilum sp. (in: g-proteobacteria)]
MTVRRVCMFGFLALCATPALAMERIFEPRDIADWEAHSFTGHTEYAYSESQPRPAVHARCIANTSSGLFLREDIDVSETPILEWTWRVGNIYRGIDETVEAGDDYPARIYV